MKMLKHRTQTKSRSAKETLKGQLLIENLQGKGELRISTDELMEVLRGPRNEKNTGR